MQKQMLTYKFKLRGGHRILRLMSSKVNFVWNYCNQTSFKAIRRDSNFLSGISLNYLTTGTSDILKLHSQTVNAVCEQYAISRKEAKKRKLSWRVSRGSKRSLGWIPFKAVGIRIENNMVRFSKHKFKFVAHREIEGKIKTGSFVEDACGDWWVTFTCEVDALPKAKFNEVGIDLGLKTLATTSDGEKFENPRVTEKYADKLAMAQRAKKKKRTARIHRKITRKKKDNLHKISAKLTRAYTKIIIGNLNLEKNKTSLDASFRGLIPFLEYKASRRQGSVIQVNEAYTTMTCNKCLERSGPTGLPGLSVREWTCASCGQMHDRDINSAINILRLGHETPRILTKP